MDFSIEQRIASLHVSPELLAKRKFRFLAEADRSVIESIGCGILFVMAFWSGTARRAWMALKELLPRVDAEGRLELVVVDTDGCPDLYTHPALLDMLAGNGEAAWIRHGQIVATSGRGFHPECFEPNTKQLLEICRGD